MAGIGNYKKGAKFTLKSGNTTPFKQMGSAPMTRSQARKLSQKHMKDGAFTAMPGESKFQMHKRLRRAGQTDPTADPKTKPETYLGKHQAAEEAKREGEGYEGKAKRKERREKFVSDIKGLGEGIMDIPRIIREKVSDVSKDVKTKVKTKKKTNVKTEGTSDIDVSDTDGNIVTDHDEDWDYKQEGDVYLTKKKGEDSWITPSAEIQEGIQQKVFPK